MENLDDEYVGINTIYEQQKEYRQTPAGKRALKRARERQLIKKMSGKMYCQGCGYEEFECLTVVFKKTLCYNCKFRRERVLEEDELCL